MAECPDVKIPNVTVSSDSVYGNAKMLAGISSDDGLTHAHLVEHQPADVKTINQQTIETLNVVNQTIQKHTQSVERPLGDTNEFANRRRTLDIAILNNTTDTLRFVEDYFYCGSWYVSPKPVNIPPREISIAYVSSRKPSILGVNGGVMYELLRQSKFLYIGFDNPTIGSYKTFIDLSGQRRSAEWACRQTKTDSVKNHYDGNYHIMAVLKPPTQSKFRLLRYTLEDITL